MSPQFLHSDDKFIIYRHQLLNESLAVFSLASGVNLIFTIHMAYQIGWQPYAIFQTVAVSSFISLWLARNKLSYNIKVFGLMICAYVITFATIINTGPVANSKAGVIVMLFIAGVFLNPPNIALVYIFIALGFAFISYLSLHNLITFHVINYEIYAHAPETWANMSIVLIAGGSVVVWIARSMINELIVSRIAADAANRAKSQFLANVSHELRSPLNTILGFTSVLLEQKQLLTPVQCEQLEIIAQSGNSLHRLVNDVLDLIRAETGRFKLQVKSTSVLIIINEIVTAIRPRSDSKGLILRIEIAPSLPPQLLLDGERLRQIVLNLLDNAIKFTERGEVILMVNYNVIDSSHISLIISIVDSGIGIELADQERIFLPFEQVHSGENKNVHGLGLGLAVCRQLVQLMNGQLTLNSIVGKGSEFSLQLPVMIDVAYKVMISQSEAELVTNKIAIDDLPLATDLAMLRELAEFRMLSEIQDWIVVNVDSYPQFTTALDELVRSCDLRMVAAFLDEYCKVANNH